MAVENTGTDHLCAIDVQYTFLDFDTFAAYPDVSD